ncbi:hypothetical protein ACLB2K_006795 [Fragaria x ananassa]
MAAAKVLSGGATMASMTARLISKLSLHQEDEPVDLGNLKSPGKGFVAQRFYLVGKLNSARAVQFDSFRSVVQAMWRLFVSVEVQQRGDRFLFMFNNQRDLGRVKKGGETIEHVLNVDQAGLRRGSTRVRITLPLNCPVRMDKRLHVSPEDVIWVQYMYERLVGLCRDCMMLNHGGLPCPNAQEAEEGTGVPIGAAPATNIASPFEF